MGMLRSRLESRINYSLSQKQSSYQELTKVLELVKNGEMILREMSEKIESARFLEEFVVIMDSAASSVSDIKGDLEQMMPAAEAALEEIHDTIFNGSTGLAAEIRREMDPAILAEVTAAIDDSKPATSEIRQASQAQDGEAPQPVPA